MANIGVMPTAADILASNEVTGAYGEHCTFRREDERVHLLSKEDIPLATASIHAANVFTDNVDPITVPYVNAFIEHTNQRVEKYWRTKSYRVVALDRKVTPAGSFAVNTRAAQALQVIAPRVQSDGERLRDLASLLMRAADLADAEDKRLLMAERDKLKV